MDKPAAAGSHRFLNREHSDNPSPLPCRVSHQAQYDTWGVFCMLNIVRIDMTKQLSLRVSEAAGEVAGEVDALLERPRDARWLLVWRTVPAPGCATPSWKASRPSWRAPEWLLCVTSFPTCRRVAEDRTRRPSSQPPSALPSLPRSNCHNCRCWRVANRSAAA